MPATSTGIHFRFDQDADASMGRNVANYNRGHILRSSESGEDDDDHDG